MSNAVQLYTQHFHTDFNGSFIAKDEFYRPAAKEDVVRAYREVIKAHPGLAVEDVSPYCRTVIDMIASMLTEKSCIEEARRLIGTLPSNPPKQTD